MYEDKIIATFVSTMAKFCLQGAADLYKDVKDELKNFLEFNVKEYLSKTLRRVTHIITILHKAAPVFIYDIYVPLSVRDRKFRMNAKELVQHCQKDIFHTTIIGLAGSGKSTFLKDLFIQFIEEKSKMPMLIELRNIEFEQLTIENYIRNELTEEAVAPNESILERQLESGSFAFFFDGFDEISYDKKKKLINSLQTFLKKYYKNTFIITSRPYSNIELLSGFRNLTIEPLDDKQIPDFIRKQIKDDNALSNKIIETVKNLPEKSPLIEYIYNPLLLSLFILTYQTNSQIPTMRHLFYRRVIDTLFITHDSLSKIGYEREYKSKLTQDKIEEVLKRFCLLTYFNNQITFDVAEINNSLNLIKGKLDIQFVNADFIEDMKVAACLWAEVDGSYTFVHRSIQEYFVALFISNSDSKSAKLLFEKILKNRIHFSEHINLLSLLKEMNSKGYNEYFLLPVLGDYLKNIKVNTKAEFKNALGKFVKGFILNKRAGEDTISPGYNMGNYFQVGEFLSIEISNFPNPFNILDLLNSQINLIQDSVELTEKKFYRIEESADLIDHLWKEKSILKIMKEAISSVKSCEKETKSRINQEEKNNQELLKLI